MIILSESRTQTVKQMVLEDKKLDSNKIKIIIKKNELQFYTVCTVVVNQKTV
jgi:hypothetical protein